MMLDYLETNDVIWEAPGQDEIAETIEKLAAREIAEEDFAAWVIAHTRSP